MELFSSPVLPGDLLVVLSGGNCPGGSVLLETFFERAQMVRERYGVRYKNPNVEVGWKLAQFSAEALRQLSAANVSRRV